MSERRRIVSVSELNLEARRVLERGLGELWVSGELSRVTLHTSGGLCDGCAGKCVGGFCSGGGDAGGAAGTGFVV